MEFDECPCCESRQLVLAARPVPGGIEVTGRCLKCGYACDSSYTTAEAADDLPYEFDWIDTARVEA